MAAPAHYIRSIHTTFSNAPHSLVAPRSASSAWSTSAQQGAYGGYTQPRRSSAAPKASLASGYAAGYNALGAGTGAASGAIMNTHNTHNYTHHLQNSAAQGQGQGQGYQGQTYAARKVQGQQQQGGQRAAGAQGGRRRSVSIRMPPTYSFSNANPSALTASAPQPPRPVSPSQLSAAAPVFTPRQALIQEATSMAATVAASHSPAPVSAHARKEKPTYKFDPFADDDVESDVASSASVSVSSADALTTAFGPYELQTIHIPPAAPRDIARYSPSRSPSPPSASFEHEPLTAPPPTPKLSAAPLPSSNSPSDAPLTTDPFSISESYSSPPTTPTGTPTIVNRPRDDYLARIVAGLLLQRQMSGRPRRRAVYAPGCGGMGMYRKSRLSAGWVGAGVGEA